MTKSFWGEGSDITKELGVHLILDYYFIDIELNIIIIIFKREQERTIMGL